MEKPLGESFLTLPHTLYLLLAGFLGFAGKQGYAWVKLWLTRKQPQADIQVTEARASEIVVRSYAKAGDAIGRFMERLEEAQSKIDTLRTKIDQQETELNLNELQIKRLTALLTIHGIKYSECDERK